jgi:hypothetical protein
MTKSLGQRAYEAAGYTTESWDYLLPINKAMWESAAQYGYQNCNEESTIAMVKVDDLCASYVTTHLHEIELIDDIAEILSDHKNPLKELMLKWQQSSNGHINQCLCELREALGIKSE